jgi:L-ribulose-5-phosphate 4-epimerase
MTEGYLKFNPFWIKEPISIDPGLLSKINQVRSELIAKGYLGVLPDGIGFGNISVRVGDTNLFIITGSATGRFLVLDISHLALVESISIAENSLVCRGLTVASSEGLSHAVIYENIREVNAVIHIHSVELWKNNFNKLHTTDAAAEFGTPEMAYSIERLTKKIQSSSGVMIMGGHVNGLIAFSTSLHHAFQQLVAL